MYDPKSLNRYAYARNNPVIYIDPDGHIAFALAGLVVAVIFVVAVAVSLRGASSKLWKLVDMADQIKAYSETHDEIESYENMRQQISSKETRTEISDFALSSKGTSGNISTLFEISDMFKPVKDKFLPWIRREKTISTPIKNDSTKFAPNKTNGMYNKNTESAPKTNYNNTESSQGRRCQYIDTEPKVNNSYRDNNTDNVPFRRIETN